MPPQTSLRPSGAKGWIADAIIIYTIYSIYSYFSSKRSKSREAFVVSSQPKGIDRQRASYNPQYRNGHNQETSQAFHQTSGEEMEGPAQVVLIGLDYNLLSSFASSDTFLGKASPFDATHTRVSVYDRTNLEDYNLGLPHPNSLVGVKYYLIDANDAADDSMVAKLRRDHGSSFAKWTNSTSGEREALLRQYNNYGIKVGLSIKLSSASVVNQMISIQDFIFKYNFQGVEVDYSDLHNATKCRSTVEMFLPSSRLEQKKLFLLEAPIFSPV